MGSKPGRAQADGDELDSRSAILIQMRRFSDSNHKLPDWLARDAEEAFPGKPRVNDKTERREEEPSLD